MSDNTFEREQEHLRETYAKLERTHERLLERAERISEEGTQTIRDMRKELAYDTSSDIHVEMAAELQTFYDAAESYSRSIAFVDAEIQRTELLLEHPYFAKLELKFQSSGKTRDIYLGAASAADDDERQYIIDWRSPVAEVYYNQANGRTSYEANGRRIEVELLCRRQFDLERDTLKACFDTTVAIEDPLLLHALSKRHSEKLSDITATIQKEQNEVVRHDDVDVLLVNGIAGSGKTSVLLQRIAYLFYQQRESLDATQVYLFSPNAVFGSYIDEVLPNMGEANPQILTWKSFMRERGLADRSPGLDTTPETLERLEAGMPDVKLQQRDIRDLRAGGRVIIRAQQIAGILGKHSDLPVGGHLVSLVTDTLLERLEQRAKQLAKDVSLQEEVEEMDVDAQIEAFGHTVELESEADILAATELYAAKLCEQVREGVENAAWLRVDRIGMRMLATSDINALEWLYLYLLITDIGAPQARYVMIDEAQDYTLAQLMVLERYFDHAHFLLLGDEHQAICEGTAGFSDIRTLFSARRETLDECRLMTSYRSSPEVTALFTGLLSEQERGLTHSVQRAGVEPEIAVYENGDIHRNVLRSLVRKARDEYALTAIITSNRAILKWTAEELPDDVAILHDGEQLPAEGVVLLDLALAKGLEFDYVIIPDAQADTYPDTPLARRRLYTAISRATHNVTLLARGTLSPLLQS